jgi:hypothetical protein
MLSALLNLPGQIKLGGSRSPNTTELRDAEHPGQGPDNDAGIASGIR